MRRFLLSCFRDDDDDDAAARAAARAAWLRVAEEEEATAAVWLRLAEEEEARAAAAAERRVQARARASDWLVTRGHLALITQQAEEERTTRERVQELPYEIQRIIFQLLPVDNLPEPDWSMETKHHAVHDGIQPTNKELRLMTFLKRLGVEMGGIELQAQPRQQWASFDEREAAMRQHRHNAYKIMEQKRQSAAADLIKANIGNPDLDPLPVGAPGESPGDLLGELPGI